MSPAPISIDDALTLAREGTEKAFCDRLGFGALVGTPPVSEEERSWSYHTVALRGTFSRAAPGIDLKTSWVYPLTKVQPRFAGTLLVGRAQSNDVCIDHESISKLHARIRMDGDAMHISDAGSKNGIELDYTPLKGERELKDGAMVRLGHYTFQFHRPASLYRMLKAV
ncbi:MAG: FHA domain-containing protein [Sandaracinaceae bacterium]